MAFLKKIFKRKASEQDPDPEIAVQAAGLDDGTTMPPAEEGPEAGSGPDQFRIDTLDIGEVNTIQIGAASGSQVADETGPAEQAEVKDTPGALMDDIGAGLEGLAGETQEQSEHTGSSSVVDGSSLDDDLLDVFEDEEPVDEQLEALVSRVEDIAAKDLAEELRSLTESLKTG